jgi:hypothetical protein
MWNDFTPFLHRCSNILFASNGQGYGGLIYKENSTVRREKFSSLYNNVGSSLYLVADDFHFPLMKIIPKGI